MGIPPMLIWTMVVAFVTVEMILGAKIPSVMIVAIITLDALPLLDFHQGGKAEAGRSDAAACRVAATPVNRGRAHGGPRGG